MSCSVVSRLVVALVVAAAAARAQPPAEPGPPASPIEPLGPADSTRPPWPADERPGATDRAGPPWPHVEQLASPSPVLRERAAEALLARGDRALLAPLVDQLFFTPPRVREQCLRVLRGLAGSEGRARTRYLDWIEYLGEHEELVPPPGYLGWKGRQLARIDPRFERLLREGAPVRLRLGEVVSGGVRFDGIPSLDGPPHVSAGEASWLADDEAVFAALLGGEARAWPVRFLAWHEMLNDRLGGEPVVLSYCTLCRSALLYRARLPGGDETTFGTSGLLYRSNKLMVDRTTLTLWSNLTGEPLLGPLATEPPRPLEPLPLLLTAWGAWRAAHPQTTVLALQPELGRRYGYDYRPGAADARRRGVSFPVPRRDRRLADREEVYGLRLGEAVKAYPLAALLAAGLVEDAVGGEPVLLHAEERSGAVRAYRRGSHRFTLAEDGTLRDERGVAWRIGEEALLAEDDSPPLPRLPGVVAAWFGWQAFYPAGELWLPPPGGPAQ